MHLPSLRAADAQKAQQEARIWEIAQEQQIGLVMLARYMRVLSDDLRRKLEGRAINIHHSFLPSFKGTKSHYQAHERGAKLIGAMVHYMMADPDEGPVIEREVECVDHSMDPEQLTAVGRDVGCMTLARVVRWHAEHRIPLNDRKTVVFK